MRKFRRNAAALLLLTGCVILLLKISSHNPPSSTPSDQRHQPVLPKVKSIEITNLHGGETLRYPVAMVTGHIRLKSETGTESFRPTIAITNLDNRTEDGRTSAETNGHRFTLLVALTPGRQAM